MLKLFAAILLTSATFIIATPVPLVGNEVRVVNKRTNDYPGYQFDGDTDPLDKRTNDYPGYKFDGDTDPLEKRTNDYPGYKFEGDTDGDVNPYKE
ncbi:hypothetical protein GP486_002007 [Trichoglossum hirsutum]|uniref:Uncharacterized protein n=1 Tax=Trichoglossum hirsutum TaxID=265104 RepID=A0A9P8LFR9_9PEZI|nr:hypothetical protein GP486_002007 [Trichoglossum hirsutum]